jgi:hypothetical protein
LANQRLLQMHPHLSALMALLVAAAGCTAAPHPRVAPEELLVIPQELARPACKELGVVDIVDGQCTLETPCDCGAYKQVKKGSPVQALSDSRLAAARKGANALWLRETTSSDSLKTHFEQCCYVTCHRVVALAFLCDAPVLARERQRVGAAPAEVGDWSPIPSLQRTTHGHSPMCCR